VKVLIRRDSAPPEKGREGVPAHVFLGHIGKIDKHAGIESVHRIAGPDVRRDGSSGPLMYNGFWLSFSEASSPEISNGPPRTQQHSSRILTRTAMASATLTRYKRGLVFTGHMTDAPGRAVPRFPPGLERRAAAALRSHIRAARAAANGSLMAISSGARGGDILFQEVCRAEGVPAWLVLPFSPDVFLAGSVRGVRRGGWIKRFWRLWDETSPDRRAVLELDGNPDPYGACNTVMLDMARSYADDVELLALWDGEGAEKPGGTAAFAEATRAAGGHVVQIDIRQLLEASRRRTRIAPS
jgi:hypothetical protein